MYTEIAVRVILTDWFYLTKRKVYPIANVNRQDLLNDLSLIHI